jgi:hypothetical protein
MMADDRAIRVAIADRDQVVENPDLRAAQEKAWRAFVRKVWGGFPQPTDARVSKTERT